MIERQLRRRGIRDERVLEAMRAIPRELFVPERFRNRAYDDTPLDIGWGQTISQPYIVAKMLESLCVASADSVLEVGTGCGYQTALLALLVKAVYTIEILPAVFELAQRNLNALKERTELPGIGARITLRCGDGSKGWPEAAPFDGIIVSAAAPDHAPEPLLQQLATGSRALIPIGVHEQSLYCFEKQGANKIHAEKLLAVRFVPLTHQYGKTDL